MSTYIDGIASSENIDSTGERVIIAGLDCSSLEHDGVFNFEHKSDQPSQIVGKILKARKIFSEKDAEDDRQLYFFKKCGVPYLYVMGELFDDYKDSARDIAGMFRYDSDKKNQNEKRVMNFSVEGAKIEKVGMDIVKSIARKVTITVLPANKAAIAEMVPVAAKRQKDDPDNIFKTETGIEIELFQPQAGAEAIPMEKSDTINPKGTSLGRTKSGMDVFSHGRVGDYKNFGMAEHRQAGELHMEASRTATDAKLKAHHSGKAQLHLQAANTAEKRSDRFATGRAQAAQRAGVVGAKIAQIPGFGGMGEAPPKMNKALTAGSGMAAPSQLEGGAALAKEDLQKSMKKTKVSKSQWLSRAEEAYNSWEKKEEFRSFMKKKLPKLAMGEIDAIGQTMALKKNFEAEQSLAKIAGMDDLHKSTVHEGVHEFEGQKHHVRITKQRKGKYFAQVSPGEAPLGAPGSVHSIHMTHVPEKNGFKTSHEVPYAHTGHTASPTSKAIRAFVHDKVKSHV